jgi:hypothetical protein
MKNIDKKSKIILSVLISVWILTWNLGFELGVFGTVLYRNLMNAWFFASITFLALLYFKFIKGNEIKFFSLLITAIPTAWPVVDYIDQRSTSEFIHDLVVAYYPLMAVALGYTIYIFLRLIKTDIFDPLTKKNLVFIVFSILLVALTGFEIGLHHYDFLACGHFRISGEFIPPNCYRHPEHPFKTFYRKSWSTPVELFRPQ